jgi:hypothetical protein
MDRHAPSFREQHRGAIPRTRRASLLAAVGQRTDEHGRVGRRLAANALHLRGPADRNPRTPSRSPTALGDASPRAGQSVRYSRIPVCYAGLRALGAGSSPDVVPPDATPVAGTARMTSPTGLDPSLTGKASPSPDYPQSPRKQTSSVDEHSRMQRQPTATIGATRPEAKRFPVLTSVRPCRGHSPAATHAGTLSAARQQRHS